MSVVRTEVYIISILLSSFINFIVLIYTVGNTVKQIHQKRIKKAYSHFVACEYYRFKLL